MSDEGCFYFVIQYLVWIISNMNPYLKKEFIQIKHFKGLLKGTKLCENNFLMMDITYL